MDQSDLDALLIRERVFTAFVRRHIALFENYACRCGTRNAEDAMEVALGACQVAWEKQWLDTTKDEEECRGWIIHHITQQMQNREARERTKERNAPELVALLSSRGMFPRPDEELEAKELYEHLLRALARLTKKQRAIFQLRIVERLPSAVVAQQLGITVTNVNVSKNQVVTILRKALAEWAPVKRNPPRKRGEAPEQPPANPIDEIDDE